MSTTFRISRIHVGQTYVYRLYISQFWTETDKSVRYKRLQYLLLVYLLNLIAHCLIINYLSKLGQNQSSKLQQLLDAELI